MLVSRLQAEAGKFSKDGGTSSIDRIPHRFTFLVYKISLITDFLCFLAFTDFLWVLSLYRGNCRENCGAFGGSSVTVHLHIGIVRLAVTQKGYATEQYRHCRRLLADL